MAGGAKKKKVTIDQPDDDMEVDGEIGSDGEVREVRPTLKMEDLVHKYLAVQQLQVIAENGMTRAIERFVDKDEKDAIKECVPSDWAHADRPASSTPPSPSAPRTSSSRSRRPTPTRTRRLMPTCADTPCSPLT